MWRWLKLWPLLGLPLMWLCNIDLYVIPFLRMNFSFWVTVILSCLLATVELIYLFWIVGWGTRNLKNLTLRVVKREVTKELSEMHEGVVLAKELVQEVKDELQEEGFVVRILDFAKKYLDPDKLKDTDIFKVLYWGGYLGVFVASSIPEPGLRLLCVFYCRLFNHRAFIALLLGNVVKTFVMVKFHEYLTEIDLLLRIVVVLLLFGFLTAVGKMIGQYVRNLKQD